MTKEILLVRSNLRRSKGQAAAILILILLSSCMLNIWLMLALDYKQNFDRCHDRLNAEHVAFTIDKEPDEINNGLTQILENDSRVTDYCMSHALSMTGSFEYNGGEMNTEFILLNKHTALTRPIGKSEIVEEDSCKSGIYLPMLYKTGDISIGKIIDISIGSHTMQYTVCGFFNNTMAGSHNCSMCILILTEDKYLELEDAGYAPKSSFVSIRIRHKEESENFEASMNEQVSEEYPDARVLMNSYELVTQSRYISQMICSGIVSAMAFFVLLVSLVVIASNIVNYIQENMKNLGALKAVGYTGRQLIASLMLQFIGISFSASIVGAAASYCIFPAVNTMMISQTGIPYTVHFLPLPFLITSIIESASVAVSVYLSTHRIRKIEPITALRQGMQTHNFKRNHIPLDQSNAPLTLALSLKTTCSSFKQNVTIFITMLVISLVVVFSALMLENMILDMTPFINLVVGETADSCINIQKEIEDDFVQKMEQDKRVEKIYLYHSINVHHAEGAVLTTTLCDDFSKVNNHDVIIKGRFPKYDNEAAVAAKYAQDTGLQVGSEITLTSGQKEASYIISGFTQMSNNLGKDCLLTRSGYEKIGSLENEDYYLNLAKDVNIDDFNEEISKAYQKKINITINVSSTIAGFSAVYVVLMTIIVSAILILCVIITGLVLYLLVRTMLNNKKRDYGIQKALGFTTRQLIFQTTLSFMPAAILSTALGLILCSLIINPLTAIFLSGIGIVKCTFHIPVIMIIISGIIMTLYTFAVTCLLSRRIKKIYPRELLSGE